MSVTAPTYTHTSDVPRPSVSASGPVVLFGTVRPPVPMLQLPIVQEVGTYSHYINTGDAVISKEPDWPPGYKSIIIDIADNWYNSSFLGLRAVEFWYKGIRYDFLPEDYTSYATSFLSDSYHHEYVFDTSLSKTGGFGGTQLLSDSGDTRNFRLICTFKEHVLFDEIRVVNSHDWGSNYLDTGARNVVISGSKVHYSDVTYNSPIEEGTTLFEGVLDKHVDEDVLDEQIISTTKDEIAATLIHAANTGQLNAGLGASIPAHFSTSQALSLLLPYRQPLSYELAALYLADAMDMLVPINIADINLSGNAGCHVQLSISPIYLDAIAGSAPPYSIRDEHGNEVYSIPDIEWSMYSGAKNTGLVVTGRTTADRQRAPQSRSVPAPKSLSPTPQHQIAHIPGAWDIVPEDTVSAGGLFVSVVDSVAIHVERGNSRSTVYG